MKLLPALAIGIVIVLAITDIESGLIIGLGLILLAAGLFLLDKLIGKR